MADMVAGGRFETLDYRIIRDDDDVRHIRATLAFVDEGDGRTEALRGLRPGCHRSGLGRPQAARSRGGVEGLGRMAGVRARGAGPAGRAGHGHEPVVRCALGPGARGPDRQRVWHLDDSALAILADVTRDRHPGYGGPTLGRAWKSRQPVASNDPVIGKPPQRAAAIRDAGLEATIAIPAVAAEETLAVLEYFSPERIEVTERLLRALNGIGHEIGYFLARHRGELVAPVLTPREMQVLQLAARALSATAIAAEMQVSHSHRQAPLRGRLREAWRLGPRGRGRGRHATRVDHLAQRTDRPICRAQPASTTGV